MFAIPRRRLNSYDIFLKLLEKTLEPVPKLIDCALNAHGANLRFDGTGLSRRLLEKPVESPVFPLNPRDLDKQSLWTSFVCHPKTEVLEQPHLFFTIPVFGL
jgi:hypothetical protein